MDLLFAEKQKLRDSFRKKRSAMTQDDVNLKSNLVNQNFINNLLPRIYSNPSDIFSVYLASYNEVKTSLITQYFCENNIGFSYPKIIAKNHPLEFILAKSQQKFEANKIYPSLLEPKEDENTKRVIPNFIIMPLLAFDHLGNRLGMGGGFFDRTISSIKEQDIKIITIGLGYCYQRIETILPTENTDQKLDFIVTEKNIFSAS